LSRKFDFLLIHGILHLSGYNHENTSSEEAAKMEKKKKKYSTKYIAAKKY